jgi:hypothetical protein
LEQTNIENTGNTTLPLLGIFKSDLASSLGRDLLRLAQPAGTSAPPAAMARDRMAQRLARGTQVQKQEYQRAITPGVK